MGMFQEPDRTGNVMGNAVVARPVPFARLRAVQAASGDGDPLAIVSEMCGVIRDYVTLADGSAIDTDGLSGAAIQKLYAFAVDMSGGGAADFT